jgi:positive regulator of sigma E activity
LLHAAVAVYGPPLLGAVCAAGAAYGLGYGDVSGAFAALVGMAFGLLVSRWYLSRDRCLSRFVPTVERRLPNLRAGL